MTSTSVADTPLYRHRFVSAGYDLLNALLWLPDGSDRLRRHFVDTLQLRRGHRVLELGCGTGLVTQHLCATGASVLAVDRAPHMLRAAQARAPSATTAVADISDGDMDGTFDWVVLAFVLHELTPPERTHVLKRSLDRLEPDGRIAVLDWARPAGPVRGALWAATIRTIEPAIALDVLDDGLDIAASTAGLGISADTTLAAGRARALHLDPTSHR